MRLKTESETGERRAARYARARLLRLALPISLLILMKKPTVLQSKLIITNLTFDNKLMKGSAIPGLENLVPVT